MHKITALQQGVHYNIKRPAKLNITTRIYPESNCACIYKFYYTVSEVKLNVALNAQEKSDYSN